MVTDLTALGELLVKDRGAVERQMAAMDADQLRLIARIPRVLNARMEFTRGGFEDFYWCLFGWELPKHASGWVDTFFAEYGREERLRGLMLKGFRGSTKSTIVSALCMYITGHKPWGSGLNVQKNEDEANRMSKYMADIVEFNAGWRSVFPHLVPDRDRGWSTEGYHLKDTREEYDKWVQKVMADHGRDPTFLASSVLSGSIGKHPSNWLLFDDIHDYKNTSSSADMKRVVNTVKADILPTLQRPGQQPFVLWAYTPWNEEDAYATIERSGIFKCVSTPAWVPDPEGDFEWEGEKGRLTWPDVIGEKEMRYWRNVLGPTEFARMYLCDLKKAKNTIFIYKTFPHEKIDPKWIKSAGVDYASVYMPTRAVEGNRSHFALCVTTKTPMNTLVVTGGFIGQIPQAMAEEKVLSMQAIYDGMGAWRTTVIESDGKGEEFINLVRRNPNIRVLPHATGGRGKADRLYREMGPWLETGVVTISDEDTPYLNTLRRFFELYPNIDKHDAGWDAADAAYHSLFAFQECLSLPVMSNALPGLTKKEKFNPWNSLGGK